MEKLQQWLADSMEKTQVHGRWVGAWCGAFLTKKRSLYIKQTLNAYRLRDVVSKRPDVDVLSWLDPSNLRIYESSKRVILNLRIFAEYT